MLNVTSGRRVLPLETSDCLDYAGVMKLLVLGSVTIETFVAIQAVEHVFGLAVSMARLGPRVGDPMGHLVLLSIVLL